LSRPYNSATSDNEFGFEYRSCIGGIAVLQVLDYLDLSGTPVGTLEPILAFAPLFGSGLGEGDVLLLEGTRVNCGVVVDLRAEGISVWTGSDCPGTP
jgi:hypothetical protein